MKAYLFTALGANYGYACDWEDNLPDLLVCGPYNECHNVYGEHSQDCQRVRSDIKTAMSYGATFVEAVYAIYNIYPIRIPFFVRWVLGFWVFHPDVYRVLHVIILVYTYIRLKLKL